MAGGVVEELVEKAGGCAVIDGGFATQLEALGADINDPLWSAACLITKPNLIKEVHLQYLEAGADVIISSSYQATIPGFLARGLLIEEAEGLLRTSVHLALEARDEFWKSTLRKSKPVYNRALVAASVGSYGAYLADGSEYSGSYGDDITVEKLKDFHRRRLQVLASARPDLIAFEAIPNKMEAQALVELLEEEDIQVPSWICFSSVDGQHLCSGESFEDCLRIINASEKVAIVGVNCTPPQFVEGIIREFKKQTEKPIAVYPNSGEVWDGRAKRWLPVECFGRKSFDVMARRWQETGASLIGGCCRTTPSTIRAVSKALKGRTGH
ncbi:homocysteine S-methyltransferase 1-like [Lolium rigidum]|uniref:homocysteine S-methyltransferase 1-like n=1 Tax=Lolium rigidum TaxID=89674 RepID=UPI001F5E0AF4|nr:homocysteine S-methyltransferase 1-like [Lolium rigidum]